MSTYAERLAWAMSIRGLNPHTDQSELARRVGLGCKPQNIQHLLDPNKNAKSSKYTPRIAQVLAIDPQWLSYEEGVRPAEGDRQPDFVIEHSDGSMTAIQYKDGTFSLEKAQLSLARDLLDRLHGSALTKALAYLQELSAIQEAATEQPSRESFSIRGGKPDPSHEKKRGT